MILKSKIKIVLDNKDILYKKTSDMIMKSTHISTSKYVLQSYNLLDFLLLTNFPKMASNFKQGIIVILGQWHGWTCGGGGCWHTIMSRSNICYQENNL